MENKINHQNDIIYFRSDDKKPIQQMASFDWKKNIEDSLKDGLIITIGAAGIFYGLKVANVRPSKASLDVIDILKLTGGICGDVLVKDYGVYKKWINE